MFFQRLYDAPLAQASYVIGCQRTGEAVVVDPNRDVQQYLDLAARERLRVTHVTETHIHADFVSGARELAARSGALLLLSAEGGAEWQYAYAAEAGAALLRDGDRFAVGNIRFEAMHTPGHTPEHLSFLVTDTATSAEPWGILTGDFVFVGDVGRPDLLEKAAGHAGTMEASARTLWKSLERFRALPDHLQLWPGHGAGSACGKALGAMPSSTVGYEKAANAALSFGDEATFVREVLAGQPEPPRYFAHMKRINREGPPLVGGFRAPPTGTLAELEALMESRATIVDARAAAAFAGGHVPGAISLPIGASFTTWAGWLLPYDRALHLVVADAAATASAVRALAMIGLDRVGTAFDASVVDAWGARHALETVPQASPSEVAALRDQGAVTVIDVRAPDEWAAGHLPGVRNIPLGQLAQRVAELPTDRPVVLQCQGGTRSAIAASVLQAHGVDRVVNLAGGFAAWQQAGLPVERDGAPALRAAPVPSPSPSARA